MSHYLRNRRAGDARDYDPRLFDLLHDLTIALGQANAEIEVVCGYRTPWSNEYLRNSQPRRGASQLTYAGDGHRHSRAGSSDVRTPGRRAGFASWCVGYHATSDFVQVDVGRVRRW